MARRRNLVLSGNVLLIFKVSSCGGPFWAPVFGPLVLSEKVLLIFEVSSVCLCVCVCVCVHVCMCVYVCDFMVSISFLQVIEKHRNPWVAADYILRVLLFLSKVDAW